MSSPSRNILDRYVAVRVANQALDKIDGGVITHLNECSHDQAKRQLVEVLELFTRGQTTYELIQLVEELAIARSKDGSDTMQLGIMPNGTFPFRGDRSSR